ncbi:MAG: hypothetical protein RR311_18760, partial [Comamonas sp.]
AAVKECPSAFSDGFDIRMYIVEFQKAMTVFVRRHEIQSQMILKKHSSMDGCRCEFGFSGQISQ